MKKYIKYSTLTKEEKKQAINKFANTKRGSELNKIYFRLIIEGNLCIAIGLGLIIYAIIKHTVWIYYLYSAFIILFGAIFIASEFILKRKKIEEMLNQ